MGLLSNTECLVWCARQACYSMQSWLRLHVREPHKWSKAAAAEQAWHLLSACPQRPRQALQPGSGTV